MIEQNTLLKSLFSKEGSEELENAREVFLDAF